jgi:transposase
MESMRRKRSNGQVVPDGRRGIVVGVDVSKRYFDFGAFRPGERGGVRRAEQNADGFEAFEGFLAQLKARGDEVWVAYEPTGPYSSCLRERLMEGGWRVVQVNPYHVKQAKELADNSPGKTDRKDCGVIAGLVWQGYWREVVAVCGVHAQLRAVWVQWRSLIKKRTRLRNEFQSLLVEWFPELGEIFDDAVCKTVRAVVKAYESPQVVAGKPLSRLRRVIKAATSGRMGRMAEPIRQAAKRSVAVTEGQRARWEYMVGLLELIESVEQQQRGVYQRMETMLDGLEEAQAMLTAPGIGLITVAGLLGECGPLGAFDSFGRLEKHAGMNLYEISSGQRRGRARLSKRGRSGVRYAMGQIAILQMRKGGLCREYAQALRERGKKPREVRVAVARKLLGLLYALAREAVAFDPQRWITEVSTADGLFIRREAPLSTAA